MESRIEQLFALVDAFCKARKLSEARVSTMVFNGGSRLAHIREGKDIGVRILERSFQWFSDHWPNGAEWPASVPRPAQSFPTEGDAA